MNLRFLIAALLSAALFTQSSRAQNPNTQREIEKAAKETLPVGVKRIEAETDAKVILEVDAASFGDDGKAWGNLNIMVNRVAAAIVEVGKDQVGKDAISGNIKKIVIVKRGADTKEDAIELKEGTLTVKTASNDESGYKLQGIITKGLQKALQLPTPPDP